MLPSAAHRIVLFSYISSLKTVTLLSHHSRTAVSPVNLHIAARCACQPFFSYFLFSACPAPLSPFISSQPLFAELKHSRFGHDSDILEPRHPFIEQDPASNDHSRSGLHRLLGAAVGLKVGVCEVFGLSSDWGIVGGSVPSDAWSPGVRVDVHKS